MHFYFKQDHATVMKTKTRSISSILGMAFGVILLFIILASFITLYFIKANQELTNNSIKNDFTNSHFISQLAISANKLKFLERSYFLNIDDQSNRIKSYRQWVTLHNRIQYILNNAIESQTNMLGYANKEALKRWQQSLLQYSNKFIPLEQRLERIPQSLRANTIESMWLANNFFKVFMEETEGMSKSKYITASNKAVKMDEYYNMLFVSVVVISVIGLVMLVAFLFIIPAFIVNPANTIIKSAEAMSKGDLKVKIGKVTISDFVPLAESLERLRISQKSLVDAIRAK
jgi:methyl-accepting chemotaxis protein